MDPSKAPITVIHVRQSKPWGGVETSIIGWLAVIDRSRFHSRLFIFKEEKQLHVPSMEMLRDVGIEAELLPWAPFKNIPGAVRGLVKAVREQPNTVIHSHDTRADIISLFAAKITGVPLIISNHAWHTKGFRETVASLGLQRWLHEAVRTPILKRSDIVINVSEDTHQETLRRGVPSDLSITIYSGLDLRPYRDPPPRSEARRTFGLADDDLVVGNIARMWPEKAQNTLVEAAEALSKTGSKVRIMIVGDGPLEETLKADVKARGLEDRVLFPGFRDDLTNVLSALDIFALPSLAEGTPIVIYSAMAMGLPIVASYVSGVAEILEDGETAILMPPGDTAVLIDALKRLEADPELRQRLGDNAKRVMEERYSADNAIRKLEAIYTDLLARRQAKGEAKPEARSSGGVA